MSDEETEVMTDADFERALDALREDGGEEVGDLLKLMNENRIISWEEAEKIMGDSSSEPVKSSLPQQTRPTEPDNETDVDSCIQKLIQNDPRLTEINLNNMKRTPIPQVKRIIQAISENTCLEKLSLANMGLYDMDVAPLIEAIEHNDTIRAINLETNYLSGDFFAKLFKAALKTQSIEEIKAVNQGVSFSTTSEREIIDAVFENRGLTKVSINLRLPEGRHKIEQATIRNQEIRRILRRQAAAEEKAAAATAAKSSKKDEKAKKDVKKPTESPPKTVSKSSDISNKPSTSKTPIKAKAELETPDVILATTKTKSPSKPVVKSAETASAPAPISRATIAKYAAEVAAKKAALAEAKTEPETPDVILATTKTKSPLKPIAKPIAKSAETASAPAPISRASIAKHAAEAAAKKAALAEAKAAEAPRLLPKTDVKKITTDTVTTEKVAKKPNEGAAKKLKPKTITPKSDTIKVEESIEETVKPKKATLKKKTSTTTKPLASTNEETTPKVPPKTRPKRIIKDPEAPAAPASRTTSFDEPMGVYPRSKLPSTSSSSGAK